MKLQYACDIRDFYKYDLLLWLGKAMKLDQGITVVPMLTPDDPSSDGLLRGPAGPRDKDLHQFLCDIERFKEQGFNCISRHITDHFNARGVSMHFVPTDGYLMENNRSQYFSNIEQQALEKCIVFMDPDIGIEVPSRNNNKYIRYAEIKDIYSRISDDSVLIIYQHWPRKARTTALQETSQRLSERAQITRPIFVDMGHIAFVALSRQDDLLMAELLGYKNKIAGTDCKLDIYWRKCGSWCVSLGPNEIF